MSKEEEEDENFGALGEPSPARDTSIVKPIGTPSPRAARFGEGAEGRGARRERGLAGPRTGFFQRTAQFVRDTRAEMRRVSWPTANEVKNTTIITLIAVIFFAIYLFAVDRVWSFLIEHLRTLMGG
ncbi:MAG: SecE/Sec61-gamma subunit of protein translocation complex [Blastocatellia bacterium]|nr:SecE/Sec61-gamma subunit of protein translocation complex [Blastocatellia bacterium]